MYTPLLIATAGEKSNAEAFMGVCLLILLWWGAYEFLAWLNAPKKITINGSSSTTITRH